jgi:outer membrane receptor protein involved in Fe transport
MKKLSVSSPARNRLTSALLAAILLPAAGQAIAQDAATEDQQATNLDKVVVTGSLIPQTQLETFSPVITITAEDIRSRGFTSVADVLQKSTVATGGVQGAQTSASFTQGAETIGMFGLDPGYTKYLIDGRPMANYPALYNGSDTFNNISNIPIDLVESIEILPGGQSSLYGSDAIAGVINIKLKKEMDGAMLNVRGGTYTGGGGNSLRVSIADGFSALDGRLNGLAGLQYETRSPIWGFQRDLTRQFNTNGTSAPIASRDFLVYGYKGIGTYGFGNFGYVPLPAEAANCDNINGLFGGTVDKQVRPGASFGEYCGSFYTPGYRTLMNEKDATQFMGHVTYDFNDNAQLYADLLYSHEKVGYHVGSNYTWWGTGIKWGYFYDPDVDGLINLQRAFAPEDMGREGFRNSMAFDTSDAYQAALGVKGYFGESDWSYDFGGAYTNYQLEENGFVRWADPINDYFQNKVLGPQQGWDPYFGAYPVFTPDYGAFYRPISQQDFESFTGYATSNSETSDAMLRAQVTNSSLFSLPGGDAGVAFALEWGQQKWDYTPDPRYLDGSIWGTTAVAGGGERDRYAATAELRMPVVDMLTLTASGRYDAFNPDGGSKLDKSTYSVGMEFRPIETLMVRGKYGTAFRAPTLSDQFQGISGFYTFVTDYYLCSVAGYDPADPAEIDQCPSQFSSRQVFGTQSGNVDLEPINADVWNVGVVWAPTNTLSFTADYYSWDIDNEVTQQSANGLMYQEYRCRAGLDPITSPTCVQALDQVTRQVSNNYVVEIYTPKINVSKRKMEAATASFNYLVDTQGWGSFMFDGNYTRILKHDRTIYEGDPTNDYLNDPYYSTDPRDRATLSGTWSKDVWSSTLYLNWMGRTPNYRASISSTGFDAPGADRLDAFATLNASVTYQALENLELSALVTNLSNEMPPEDDSYPGTSGAPYNSANYSVYGRAVYFEIRYKFGQ